MCTLLSTRYLIFESTMRNHKSSWRILRKNTFFVVRRGNPCERSKRNILPNTDFSSMPVLNSCFMAPFSKISLRRLRYWCSGYIMILYHNESFHHSGPYCRRFHTQKSWPFPPAMEKPGRQTILYCKDKRGQGGGYGPEYGENLQEAHARASKHHLRQEQG